MNKVDKILDRIFKDKEFLIQDDKLIKEAMRKIVWEAWRESAFVITSRTKLQFDEWYDKEVK